MLTKKAYTLEELILYLEALEMLDMIYTIEKLPDVWMIKYQPDDSFKEEPRIEFED
jgi:hypothetical protein